MNRKVIESGHDYATGVSFPKESAIAWADLRVEHSKNILDGTPITEVSLHIKAPELQDPNVSPHHYHPDHAELRVSVLSIVDDKGKKKFRVIYHGDVEVESS